MNHIIGASRFSRNRETLKNQDKSLEIYKKQWLRLADKIPLLLKENILRSCLKRQKTLESKKQTWTKSSEKYFLTALMYILRLVPHKFIRINQIDKNLPRKYAFV